MNQLNQFAYLQEDDFQAVDLPYGAGRFHMTVILPSPGTDIAIFAAQFGAERWEAVRTQLQEKESVRKVSLFLPRFKLRCSLREALKEALSSMGMATAFTPGRADFSRINARDGKNLFISDILHKTFIQVDEKGTEAAGATAVIISRTSVPSNPTVVVNRPFLFLIWEEQTNAILFVGKILELEEG